MFLKILQIIVISIIWIINIYLVICFRKYEDRTCFNEAKRNIFQLYSLNQFKLLLDKLKERKFQKEEHKFISQNELFSGKNQAKKGSHQIKQDVEASGNKFRNIRVSKKRHSFSINCLINKLYHFFNFTEKDGFYYPQRLLIAIELSLSTLIYCFPISISFTISIINFFDQVKYNVIEKIFQYENLLISSLQIKLRTNITESDIRYYDKMINYMLDVVNSIVISLKNSVIIANVISLLIVLFSISMLVYNFRKIIMKKRILGDKLLSSKKIKVKTSSEFIGQLFANTTLEYFILSMTLTILISLLINKFTWITIWENIIVLIIFFTPTIVDILISIISSKIIVNDYIFHRNLMQMVDSYKIVMAILEGLNISFYRFVIGFIGVIIGLTRFDQTLMPSWVNKLVKLDSMNNSYESFILSYHEYSNPIKTTIIKFLIEKSPGRSMSKAQKKAWKIFFIKRMFIDYKNVCKKTDFFSLRNNQPERTKK